MQRQTFINETEARGYETTTLPNVKAKRGDITLRLVPLGEHTPHTQQDYDDIAESAYRLSADEEPIENEPEKRRNNGK